MNIAVIPARGGSKRIPNKNIKEFCGKPIISWPINIAKNSGLFDKIIVSTDSKEIAKISSEYGAEIPFIRPSKISDDHTGTIDVISHAISWMSKQKWKVAKVCCIYPTSVFLNEKDLQKGLKVINSGYWKFSFSITEYNYTIFRSFKLLDNGGVEMLYPNNFETRSQDLQKVYHDAAQFCWGLSSAWLSKLKVFDHYSYGVIIPNWRVQDIDNENDWKRAESIFKYINSRSLK